MIINILSCKLLAKTSVKKQKTSVQTGIRSEVSDYKAVQGQVHFRWFYGIHFSIMIWEKVPPLPEKRAILLYLLQCCQHVKAETWMQIWHTGVRSTWHSLNKPQPLILECHSKKRNKQQKKKRKKRQYERDKVMLEMARTSKKISSRNNSAGFKTPSSTRLHFNVF